VGPAAVLPLVLLASGCASVFGSYATGPHGIAAHDHELRTLLSQGRYDSAMTRVAPDRSRAGDELLRLQNQVLVARHAGRLEESAAALEEAVVLAEDRYTRSVSKAVLSAFTNDRILPYRPPPTERLLLHYYGALVHLRLGGPSAAAVEARRLEGLLQRAEDEEEPAGARRDLHVALHRLAGTIFEAAGDANAAGVAHRRAARLEGTRAAALDGDAGDREEGDPYGEVVLAVEQGFVAHRVERSLNVPVWPEEMDRMAAASDSSDEETRYASALSVARRALANGGDGGDGSSPSGDGGSEPQVAATADPRECGVRVIPGVGRVLSPCEDGRQRLERRRARRELEGTPRLLRVAWPEYRVVSRPDPVHVRAGEEATGSRDRWSVDLSAAVVEEFGERAPEVLAKALLRAAVKNVVAGTVEDEVEEEDEALGEVTGVALNVLGALTERADTRSWNLLPGRIQLVRLRLPAGEHRLEVVSGRDVRGERRHAETVDVRVPAGGVTVASVRLWR
jgi:hypothetical protein